MPRLARSLALISITAIATAAAVLPDATAQSPTPAIAQSTAPQLVSGLPDFTHLVEQVGPAVVNVEAGVAPRQTARGQGPGDDEMEIFRRFFGPDAMPGMPRPGGPRRPSMGSGFIISSDGYVLTNHHVVDGADEVKVKLSDRREYTAKVVGSDEESDVALLKIAATGLPALRIGDSKTLKAGQWVAAIGSPFGLDHSVTAGIVSAVGRANPYSNQRYVPFIQTDVAINRGNSGGPLLDTRGQVVGINSLIFSNSGYYMGVSFAIPIDVAMNVSQQLRTTGKVARGQLGVSLNMIPIDAEQSNALGLPDLRGALVNGVQAGGAAGKAGIERMDVIRSINGIAINLPGDVPPMIGAIAPGTRVNVGLIRNGQPREVNVTLTVLDTLSAVGAPQQAGPGSSRAPMPANSSNLLGLVCQDLNADDRRQAGLGLSEGVVVARVEGLAVRRSGIQPGDVILAVGRVSVGSVASVNHELSRVKTGETLMILILRGGATRYVAIPSGGSGG